MKQDLWDPFLRSTLLRNHGAYTELSLHRADPPLVPKVWPTGWTKEVLEASHAVEGSYMSLVKTVDAGSSIQGLI